MPQIPSHKKKRIALFTGNYNHIADGVSLTLNRLVAYLECKGSEVLVLGPTIDDPPLKNTKGTFLAVPSIPMPGRKEYRITTRFPKSLQKKVLDFKPDLIHIATPDVLGIGAIKLAKRHHIPLVATFHTHFESYFKYYLVLRLFSKPLKKFIINFYHNFQHIYVPSTSMAAIVRSYGIPEEKLFLWERGVETQTFHPHKRSLAWRKTWGISDDEVVITFVSRLVIEKGLDVFAAVIELLKKNSLPHRSIIVGEGPAKEMLQERLPETIFTGYQAGDDLATAYASSDIFLFPSHTETFGNVTLEAMASGIPCVCADATGSNQLVLPEKTGYLAPPQNVEAFYAFTLALLQDKEKRAAFGKAGRERSILYDWETVLAKIDGYYNQLLASK